MDDYQDGKEERAPRLVPDVDGVRDAGHDSDDVEHEDRGRGDKEGRPLEHVELCEVVILIGHLRRDREDDVDPGQHLHETLEDGEEMHGRPADHPKLLVPPPVLDTDAAPPHLEYACGINRDEEENKPHVIKVAYLH